ncbi:hypothetical protein GCM10022409_34720 [Hymenobacter glaciei]|uniref:Uncharacterized protein n=1 Tax=Hymenobacter glaciei TaxID=877209 RepID=A0ABP7UK54_9BACT
MLALSSLTAVPAFAQHHVSATVSQSNQTSFKIEEPAFVIYLSNAGQIADFSVNARGKFAYDLHGRLEKAGPIAIDYDLHNRIEKIGDESISYDLHGRVEKIGTLRISYDLHNRIDQIGDTRISYDFHGRVDNID